MYAIKGDHIHINDAQELEGKQEWQAAAALYEKLLRQSPKNIRIIQRLLVLFRKMGNVKKEIHYIDAAIRIHQQKYTISNHLNKKATDLSRQLNKMLGHTDKKGKPVMVADEILKLELRKIRLIKKQQNQPGKK